jgi:xanthine dehydrogenase small subunit
MRNFLQLFINGRCVKVEGDDAFLTLSEYLRRRQRLIGTKVVCAEGDCGSCSVLIGRIEGEQINYASVTSCIQLMFQLDAAHVVTIEGLRDGGELNPIQSAMVKCQGTQCGFCTPGFVVSLYDIMKDGQPCDAEKVRRGLVGNLCRCTGYDSIVKTALETDREKLKSLDALYPPGNILSVLKSTAAEEVLIETSRKRFYKPVMLEQAIQFRAAHPQAVIISGATDLGVLSNKRVREIVSAMSTSGLPELRAITSDENSLYVGACATLSALERAALEYIPELGRFLSWFGSPLIKNAGTLAGNLVTGSPIGDSIPPLTVLEAEIDLAGTAGTRRVPIGKFYTGYRQTVMKPDEIVTGVRIPFVREGEILKLYKISRRLDLDISTFSAAICVQKSDEYIHDIRIAYGGVGPMVMRMNKTEAMLRGREATLENFEQAANVARDEVVPISDVRGSQEYRRMLAGNILLRFWHETIESVGMTSGK